MKLRGYQRFGVTKIFQNHRELGVKRQVLVSPTGSGKGVMGAAMVRSARSAGVSVLAIAHRRELISQLCEKFGSDAAAICPGFDRNPDAPIQVATIQTLLASGLRPEAGFVLWDECHHVPSDEWGGLLSDYQDARVVGLTATPSRSDGRALGDIFEEMVVAASYSELIELGHIVPCRVFQAPQVMESCELALDPLDAMKKHARGGSFVFCKDVDHAYEVAIKLNENDISSAVIEANTPSDVRASELSRFKESWLDALVNVYTLTEGVDVPAAETCVIARSVGHPSTYLQMAGRVLRPAPGKEEAVLIDLSGASLLHGLPTEDRNYSLCGKPIGRKSDAGVRVCLSCGYTYLATPGACPNCGFVMQQKKKQVKIYNSELREVYAGIDTPAAAKGKELERLIALVEAKGWNLSWALKKYKEIFFESAPVWRIPMDARMRWFNEMVQYARTKGHKKGYPFARYYAQFKCWPEWR